MLRTLLGLSMVGILFSACSSSSKIAQENLGFEQAPHLGSVSKLWTRTMPGQVTDVTLAADGSRGLLTLIPDTEGLVKEPMQPKIKEPSLALLTEKGELAWVKAVSARPKWQAYAAKGDFIAVTTFEGKLSAYDGDGKLLWEKDDYCRPILLEKTARILCHRWDDAKPTGLGFDIYDRVGNKVASFPVSGELLDVSVSSDEKFVALALTSGRVQIVDLATVKPVWDVRIPGQMIGISLSSGNDPLLAAFFYKKSDAGRHQATLALFSAGKQIDEVLPTGHFDQVATSPSGQVVAVYGNSPHGQALASFGRPDPVQPKLKEIWRHQSPRYSDYNSALVVTDERILVGFEDGSVPDSGKSLSHLFSFDRAGKVEWAIPLVSDEGGYLFSYAKEGREKTLFGVSDNGEVSGFRIRME